jgi:hypothetical protein
MKKFWFIFLSCILVSGCESNNTRGDISKSSGLDCKQFGTGSYTAKITFSDFLEKHVVDVNLASPGSEVKFYKLSVYEDQNSINFRKEIYQVLDNRGVPTNVFTIRKTSDEDNLLRLDKKNLSAELAIDIFHMLLESADSNLNSEGFNSLRSLEFECSYF